MTTIQVNGNAEKPISPAAGSANKTASTDGGSFGKEMESAVAAITSVAVPQEQISTGGTGAQQLEETNLSALEKMLDSLLALMKAQPDPGKDNSEISPELYSVLQQIYQLMTGENQIQVQLTRPAEQQLIVSSQQLLAIYQNLGAKKETLPGAAELTQKVVNLLSSLSPEKEGNLPKDFLAKVQEALRLLNSPGKQTAATTGETGSRIEQATAPVQADTKQVPAKGAVMAPVEQPNDSETSQTPVQEDGEATKVGHHQSQNPMPASVEKNQTVWKSSTDTPLIPSRFFAKEIEAMVARQIQVNRGTGAVETTLRLFPENLGQVDVRITALNGQITAHFVTSSTAGKEAVEQQLHQLRSALIQQGLYVEKIEVSQNSTTAAGASNNDMLDQGKGNSRQQQQGEKQEESSEPAPVFDLASLLQEDEPAAGSSMSKEINTIA
ncbi:flagellar hook-length control protein FliK [Aneurinibacillus tyrosinisolvens]|uniref:flagellar hook-length control protein FliK n=1 Tax=Aneurinibacillus tyrosinisolvens TaxID=1443435 RepID=UPI00063F25EA|nr:flagellar hook-length control protein FliK [Aneurinibacillus tyrosinisolvens]